MIKLLILDRDGILNNVVMRGKIKSSPRNLSELELPKDSYEVKKFLNKLKIKVVVATNQPDISRKLLTKKNNQLIMREISLFYEIPLENFFVCPHDDSDNCNCRKPKPGMINMALDKFNIDPSEAIMIGDSLKDIQASFNASLREELFISNNFKNKYLNNSKYSNVPNFNLTSEALQYISRKYLSE